VGPAPAYSHCPEPGAGLLPTTTGPSPPPGVAEGSGVADGSGDVDGSGVRVGRGVAVGVVPLSVT
jgi:hypothetical protein